MGSLQKFWSAPRTGAEPEQPLWAGKTQICGFSEKKKKNLFSLQGRQKFGSNTGQVMEGERGESGKAADFCKGVEACPSCKKGKRVWLERKAEVTGICYSYSCVKGGEGTEQSLPASWGRRSLSPTTPLHRGVGHGSRLSFIHLQEYFFLREGDQGTTRSRILETCISQKGPKRNLKVLDKTSSCPCICAIPGSQTDTLLLPCSQTEAPPAPTLRWCSAQPLPQPAYASWPTLQLLPDLLHSHTHAHLCRNTPASSWSRAAK